jgi:hypothetical protein
MEPGPVGQPGERVDAVPNGQLRGQRGATQCQCHLGAEAVERLPRLGRDRPPPAHQHGAPAAVRGRQRRQQRRLAAAGRLRLAVGVHQPHPHRLLGSQQLPGGADGGALQRRRVGRLAQLRGGPGEHALPGGGAPVAAAELAQPEGQGGTRHQRRRGDQAEQWKHAVNVGSGAVR